MRRTETPGSSHGRASTAGHRPNTDTEHERGGANDDRGRRQRRDQDDAADEADDGDHGGPASLFAREGEGGSVGDGVVGEHGDAGDGERVAEADDGDDRDHDSGDTQLGTDRDGAPWLDVRESARELVLAGHRQGGARDARDQVEQGAERGDAGADAHDPADVDVAGVGNESKGRVGAGELCGVDGGQRGDPDDGVDGQHDEQRAVDRLGDGGLRIADFFAEGGDPGVPGEGEEHEPGGLQDAVRVAVDRREPLEVGARARPPGHHDGRERGERHGQEDPRDHDGSGEATEVDQGDGDDCRDPHRSRTLRPQIGADGQRHRRARGDLADHEPPSGEMTPTGAELPAAVHVGTARFRMHGGELGRRRGVAEGDDRGDRQTDEQPTPGGACRRRPGGEDTGADHGSGTDDHGVVQPEPSLERADAGHAADRPVRDWPAGTVRRRCRMDPGAGSASRRALPRRRCGTGRRRRGAARLRCRGRRR